MSLRTSLGIALAAALPLLLDAGNARAQGASKPVAPPVAAPYRVDGFSPKTGRPGVRVTISGAGFARGTKVLVGGRVARVSSVSPGKIVFAVPNLDAGADIVLRMPGVASDLAVGTFDLLVDPVIRSMSPVSGAPGTKVVLLGRGFKAADTFTIAGKTLITESIQPERATVTVPDGASTDYVALARPNGEKARSAVRFRVNPTAPVIGGMSPELGVPGTTVRLSGTGFTARDRIYYGNRSAAMTVLGRGAGWLDVMVPKNARQNQLITLIGPGGTARSPRPFQLDLPPVLTSFSPRLGSAGTQVELFGDHFRDGDWVSLAGKRLPIVQLRERQISIKIPPGSQSGPIAVGRESTTVVARGTFEVLHAPNLVAFMPTRGEVGTRVTLSGQHLVGGKVFYGARPVRVLETRGEGTVVVQVPPGARDEKLRVRTRGGEAETHRPFQVLVLAAVSEVKPRAIGGGGTLELRGRNLDRATQFFIGQLPLEIESRDARRAIVRVPVDARTSPLEWLSQGVRSRTGFPITIIAPPRISQFQPLAGPPGTKIIIRGQNFGRSAEVFFGKVPLKVVSRRDNELVAVVPRGIGGEDRLVVHSQGSRARSDQSFAVRVPPIILSASPTRGSAGSQVLVRGQWFDDSTEILFDKMRARVLKREAGSILVEVPRGVPAGAHALVAKTDQLQTTFRESFTVLGRAVPARWDHAGWEMLGSRVVDGKADRDVIEVGGARAGAFTRLMLVVEESDLEMFDVVIEFASGQKHSPKIRQVFREDTRTRAIDLPGNKRAIKRITFRYGNLPGGGRARVEVWARGAAPPASPAPPPGKVRSAPPASSPAARVRPAPPAGAAVKDRSK